jgi:predicted component of type VI protein secretion system
MKHLLLTTIAAVVLVGCEKAPSKQDTQLKIAVQSMDVERTKKILSEGNVNINVRMFRDAPPIYQAAYRSNAEMTKLLIENGADLSQRDFQGETALHTAAFHSPGKGLTVIQLLLNAGADVNAKRNDGNTPLDLATMGFRSKGAFAPPGFSSSSNKMRIEYQKVVQLLMRNGGRTSK